jgi:hypothetical protein
MDELRRIAGPATAGVESRPLSGSETRRGAQPAAPLWAASLLESGRLEALKAYDVVLESLHLELRDSRDAPDPGALSVLSEAIAESDALVEVVETPAFEAKIVDRDLLSPKSRSLWGASAGVTYAPGTPMTLEGVSLPGRLVTGVVSVLPARAAPWNDLVIELEFTLLAGEMDMYLRYWPDRKSYRIRFAPTEGYEMNRPYPMTIRVKGSQVSLKQPDQPENRDRLQPSVSRTGGFGFGLPPGSKAEISKLRMKVLR